MQVHSNKNATLELVSSHCEPITGKYFTEALILPSTNPQYEKDCSLIYQVST